MSAETDGRFGFPKPLLGILNGVEGVGPSSPCGLCGDTILGQRHRIIDAITERLLVGEEDPGYDWDIDPVNVGVIVAAHYEHDKALARQRRAERRVAKATAEAEGPA